ncbi:MAG: helix-turn-helix domain-containing protein [Proteobacteria bacterium]|nr:helix-turn-helix domain-containing protein [Pseudomonadota bacterium]
MPPSTQQMLSALGVSAATMSNWKTRGMSKEGALRAEAVYGCSAHWLLTGEGPEQAHAVGSAAPVESWPFRRIDYAKVKALSPARLAELETAVLIAAGHLGLDVRESDDRR